MDLSDLPLVILLLMFLSGNIIQSMSNHKKAVSLYNANDTILQLDYSNINATLFGKDTAFFVEFYSSWCGHCIHFAPQWRKLAAETYQWSKVIQMGAINCAAEENFPVCTSFEIKGFPTLKLFPARAVSGQKGLEVKQIQDFRPKMVDYIEMHFDAQRPKHWPVFRPLDAKTSYDSLPSHFADFRVKGDAMAVVLVFHSASSPYEPKYVTLHLSSDPRIVVFGVDVDAFRKAGNRAFLDKFGHNSDKAIAYLLTFSTDRGPNSPAFSVTSLNDVDLRDALALQRKLKKLLPWTSVGLTFTQPPAALGASPSVDLPPPPPKGVFMSDLIKGIHYAFVGEIGIRPAIEVGEDLDAVNAFVSILTKYFPGDDSAMRFLRQINGWLQSRGNVSVSGREWKRRVANAAASAFGGASSDGKVGVDISLVAHVKGAEKWVGCRGSRPTLRGYPCAMWNLFHVLSVSAADFNRDIPEDKVNGREVVEAMAKYIKSFFGCRECASHFETMVNDDLDDSVQSFDDVILWLWKAHNKVNARLKGESSEDPQAPKIQFPDVETCLSCRIEGNQAAWHYINVKQFLKNHYRNISSMEGGVMGGKGGGGGGISGPRNKMKEEPKKRSGIESIEGSIEKPRYHPGGIAKIKKEHQEKKMKLAAKALIGDHVDVEKLRRREQATRRRKMPSIAGGILGFTDWDVRICFGAYGFCALILVALYIVYVDRRCRHRLCGLEKKRRPSDDSKLGKVPLL